MTYDIELSLYWFQRWHLQSSTKLLFIDWLVDKYKPEVFSVDLCWYLRKTISKIQDENEYKEKWLIETNELSANFDRNMDDFLRKASFNDGCNIILIPVMHTPQSYSNFHSVLCVVYKNDNRMDFYDSSRLTTKEKYIEDDLIPFLLKSNYRNDISGPSNS